MDGNGRWAKKRGLPRTAGHKAGAEVFKSISKECDRLGIKYATFYAFSTENWKRPQSEVDALMALFKNYLLEAKADVKALTDSAVAQLSHFNNTEFLEKLAYSLINRES